MNHIYPRREDFIKLFNQYNRAYLSMSIQGDTETPISLYKKLQKGKGSFLLESVENGKDWGQFSHIGRAPFMALIGRGELLKIIKGNLTQTIQGNTILALKEILDSLKLPKDQHMAGYFGGGVGFIGYDIARHNEGIYFDKPDDIDTPDMHLIFPQEIISYDHERKEIIITVHMIEADNSLSAYEEAKSRLEQIRMEINSHFPSFSEPKSISRDIKISSTETKESFINKVQQVKEHIKKGDIFQGVLSQRFNIVTDMDPFEAYRSLRIINPSPYMYFIDFGDYVVVGSSPEMLTKVEVDTVTTCPIAGTRPRGKDEKEDLFNEKDLLSDEKEIAEHVMLVDLARNDIGRVSEFGSVELKEYMGIRRYSHVMHIVSLVDGKLKKDRHIIDGLISCLPAGTVSGAPKKRAMEIIDTLEDKKRGIYAGAVGWFGFDGSMDTCIAIRTIIFKDHHAYIQAGAGIVADSNPESEYEETLRKAKAMLDAISINGGDFK